MLAYIKAVALKPGSAQITLITLDMDAVRGLMPLIGEKLNVRLEQAQLPLPIDGHHPLEAFR